MNADDADLVDAKGFIEQKSTHMKAAHKSHKKHHKRSHSKKKHAHRAEDPFAASFEESLTRQAPHGHGPHSHAQRKSMHKKHHVSVPACTSLGCKTDSWAKPPADPWPKDYKVANHGVDHDIKTSDSNTAAAEAKLGAWVPKQDEDGKWIVPTETAEFKLTGTQTDVRMTSDPICSSAGCTQYEHPHKETHKMNYFVPNFGKDHDIKASEDSALKSEQTLGHTFTPKFDEEKDEWVVPSADIEFRLAGV